LAGPPTRFRTVSRLPLVRVGPIIGIIRRIGLTQICFANGFIFALPNCVLHGLPDEFSPLPLGGATLFNDRKRFVELDQYRRHSLKIILWKHIDRSMTNGAPFMIAPIGEGFLVSWGFGRGFVRAPRKSGYPRFPVESCGFDQPCVVLFTENHMRGRRCER
jgi:hypothetical protein